MAEFLTLTDFEKYLKKNEERLIAFGQRIGDVQSLKEDEKALRISLDQKDSLINGMVTVIDDISKTLKAHTALLEAHQDQLSKQKVENTAKQDNLKKAFDLTRIAISDVATAHKSTSDKIIDLSAQLAGISSLKRELDAHKEDVQMFKQSAITQVESVKSYTQKLFNEVSAIKSDIVKTIDFKSSYESDKQYISSSLSKIANSIVNAKNEVATAADSKVEALKKDLSDKIISIKIPDLKDVVSPDRVAKIESQIESIALDAKNAFLKSSNVDMQTQLHNKKIENIQLLLKQHELNK